MVKTFGDIGMITTERKSNDIVRKDLQRLLKYGMI